MTSVRRIISPRYRAAKMNWTLESMVQTGTIRVRSLGADARMESRWARQRSNSKSSMRGVWWLAAAGNQTQRDWSGPLLFGSPELGPVAL